MIFCIVKKNSMACSIMKYNRSFNDYHWKKYVNNEVDDGVESYAC
jgi:hypothetical protein